MGDVHVDGEGCKVLESGLGLSLGDRKSVLGGWGYIWNYVVVLM